VLFIDIYCVMDAWWAIQLCNDICRTSWHNWRDCIARDNLDMKYDDKGIFDEYNGDEPVLDDDLKVHSLFVIQ
jgi:hypothetical protein